MTWHDIPGFSNYQVSKSCIIRKRKLVSKGNDKLVLNHTWDYNYLGVKMKNDDGVWKRVKVHVVMMLTFVGPRPEGLVINHIDGNKENNNLDNLEYCTSLENERHSLDVLGKTHLRGKNGCFIAATTT